MAVKVKRVKLAAAVTLVEIMVAMVVLTIAALGATAYQYHAAKQTRVASAQVTATRTAQLLLEDWKSTGGSIDYSPDSLGLGFSALTTQDTVVLQYGRTYTITIDDIPMFVALGWHDCRPGIK